MRGGPERVLVAEGSPTLQPAKTPGPPSYTHPGNEFCQQLRQAGSRSLPSQASGGGHAWQTLNFKLLEPCAENPPVELWTQDPWKLRGDKSMFFYTRQFVVICYRDISNE